MILELLDEFITHIDKKYKVYNYETGIALVSLGAYYLFLFNIFFLIQTAIDTNFNTITKITIVIFYLALIELMFFIDIKTFKDFYNKKFNLSLTFLWKMVKGFEIIFIIGLVLDIKWIYKNTPISAMAYLLAILGILGLMFGFLYLNNILANKIIKSNIEDLENKKKHGGR